MLAVPYTGRRARLEDLGLDEDPVRTPPWYPGGAADIWAVSAAHGLKGVVGKPLASRYYPGARRDWIKAKNVRHQEVIICGWTPGQGRRAAPCPGQTQDCIDSLRLYGRGSADS